ncbi:MAG: dihydroneopterin aldolase [Firmicutes bacterium]|nr:dihydroneopterin aldolase [Bacillota bacterium]
MYMAERGRVSISSMEFYGYHGCMPEERRAGQPYFVDVDVFLDLERAGATDDLSASVDYSKVFAMARDVVEGEPRNLIEAVAFDIARRVLEAFSPDKVTVRVRKPRPPVGGKALFAEAEVSLLRGE